MPHVCRCLSKPEGVRSLQLELQAAECWGPNSASAANALARPAVSPAALGAPWISCAHRCARLLEALPELHNDIPSLFIPDISQPFYVDFRSPRLLFCLNLASDSETIPASFGDFYTPASLLQIPVSIQLFITIQVTQPFKYQCCTVYTIQRWSAVYMVDWVVPTQAILPEG